MDLLIVLTYEQDILSLIVSYLDLQSLLTLESCSSQARQMFQNFKVWNIYFANLSRSLDTGYDWHKRLLDEKAPDFKKMTLTLAGVQDKWLKGPVKTTNIPLDQPVVDIAMDETNIVVGFKSGAIVVFGRDTLAMEKIIQSKLVRISKLGISPHFIYAGDIRNDRFYNPGSPSVCLFHRPTGSLAQVLSFQGGLSINQILPGSNNFTIISHSSYSDLETSFITSISVYKLSHKETEPTVFSNLDVSTKLKYSVSNKRLSKFSLSKCKNRFITIDSPESHKISVFNLDAGSAQSILVTAPEKLTLQTWSMHEFGYLSQELIFILWQNKAGWCSRLDLLGGSEGSVVTTIDLTPFSWDVRLGFVSTGWQLLALHRQESSTSSSSDVMAVNKTGAVGFVGFGEWNSHNCKDMYADPSSLVCYVRESGQYSLLVWDFVIKEKHEMK